MDQFLSRATSQISPRYTSCLSPYFFIQGVPNPFSDQYSFLLCIEVTVCLYVLSYIFKCALDLYYNCNELRSRNTIQLQIYMN